MDISAVILVMVWSVISLGAGWIIGRAMDLHYRAKLMKQFFKKDYGLVGLVSKDWKTIKYRIANFSKDYIQVGKNEVWIIESSHIYRQDKPEKGFYAEEHNVKWEEGVPVIYVDRDNLKPIDFYPQTGNVKPEQVGAVLNAWVANAMAKGALAMKNQQMMLLICILVGLLAFGMAYMAWQGVNQTNAKLDIITNALNGTMVVPGGDVIVGPTPIHTPTQVR